MWRGFSVDSLHYEKFADGTVKEIEVPFDIPDSWQWCRIDQLALAKGGKRVPKGMKLQEEENDYPYLRVTDMKNETILDTKIQYAPPQVREVIKNYTISSDDLYITIAGTIGNAGTIPTQFDGALLTENALKLIIYPLVNKMFLLRAINSPAIQNQFLELFNQVAQPKLSIRSTNSTLIPLPPSTEQKRILERLEGVFEVLPKYEISYAELAKLNKEFPEKLRKSILQYAMQGKLVPQDPNDEPVEVLLEKIRQEKQKLFEEGKLKKKDLQESTIYKGDDNSYYENIPDAWISTTLGNIGVWGAGATPSRSNPKYYGGDIPWLKTGDLTDGLVTDIPEHITELALEKTSVKLNPTNSVLIAMYGATIGKLGILTFPATTNQACCACQPIPAVNNWFLFYYLMSIRKQFIDSAEGGAQPNISRIKIVNTPFPMPSYAEQVRIVGRIEKSFDLVSQLLQ
nr:restriction endonuclease subunit S [Lactococcus petauri]